MFIIIIIIIIAVVVIMHENITSLVELTIITMYFTVRSSDKLLLAMLVKVYHIITISMWHSLSYNCTSGALLTTFKCNLKTELYDTAYSKRSASSLLRCISNSPVTAIIIIIIIIHLYSAVRS